MNGVSSDVVALRDNDVVRMGASPLVFRAAQNEVNDGRTEALFGSSTAMRSLQAQIDLVGPTDAWVRGQGGPLLRLQGRLRA